MKKSILLILMLFSYQSVFADDSIRTLKERISELNELSGVTSGQIVRRNIIKDEVIEKFIYNVCSKTFNDFDKASCFKKSINYTLENPNVSDKIKSSYRYILKVCSTKAWFNGPQQKKCFIKYMSKVAKNDEIIRIKNFNVKNKILTELFPSNPGIFFNSGLERRLKATRLLHKHLPIERVILIGCKEFSSPEQNKCLRKGLKRIVSYSEELNFPESKVNSAKAILDLCRNMTDSSCYKPLMKKHFPPKMPNSCPGKVFTAVKEFLL